MRLLATFLFLLATLAAQSVRWEPAGGSLALNRASELQLVFENCESDGDPAIPAVDGLQLDRTGQVSSTNIINGKVTESEVHTFSARPTAEKTITIPSFRAKTNKGAISVPAATFTVTQAAAAGGTIPLDSVARSVLQIPNEVYAGEVFTVDYRLTALRRYLHQAASDLRWNSDPLVLEDWPQLSAENLLSGGEKQVLFKKSTRAVARTPGDLTLNKGDQLLNIVTGTSAFGFFTSPNLEQFAITTPAPALRVKPLPGGAPATFTGAVGQFELKSRVVPEKVKVGEPVTWTLSVSGTGNWPDIAGIAPRDVSTQFRAVQTQPKRTLKPNTLFDGTLEEDVVLIPTEPGTYSFGPYEWSWFDPATGQYRTQRTPVQTVTIAPASAPTGGGGGTGAGGSARASASAPPGLPAPVPGGAVESQWLGRAPLAPGSWLMRLSLALALFPMLWAVLAYARARVLDPRRPARAARKRALALCSALTGPRAGTGAQRASVIADDEASGAQREALSESRALEGAVHSSRSGHRAAPAAALPELAEWQGEIARAIGLNEGYPRAGALDAFPALKQVWNEAEAVRFGKASALPDDWGTRAAEAIRALPPASFDWRVLGQTRSWWPASMVVFGLVVSFGGAPNAFAQGPASPDAAYRRGEYVVAEAGWRTQLEKAPLRADAHLNLSLALSQQNQWQEATAHAVLAFVQAPGQDASVRQLRYCLKQPTYTPAGVDTLLSDGTFATFLRTFSPRGWQNLAVAGAALAALTLAGGVALRFGWLPRWARAPLVVFGGLGGVTSLVAAYSWSNYGVYRDERAALVWRDTALYSVPTAADAQQKKSAVEPGTVAVVSRTYLSWSELQFTNGETGWVQSADVMPLWK